MGTWLGSKWNCVHLVLFSNVIAESEELHIERFTLAIALNQEEEQTEEEVAEGENIETEELGDEDVQ